MAKQANPTGGAAGPCQRPDDPGAPAGQFRRNCLAAFDEIRTGLSNYMLAHPEVSRGRAGRGAVRGPRRG